MTEKFNPNSFTTFLQTMNRAASKARTAELSPGIILRKLAGSPELRMDMPSLLASTDLPLDVFANAMREYAAAGLLVTQSSNGRETATLTPVGEQVARVEL